VTLAIDGQTLTSNGGNGAAKQFSWPGTQSGAQPIVNLGGTTDIGWETHQGLWGVFKFFWRAETPAGPGRLEWVIRTGDQPMRLPDGKPLTVRFDLDMGATPPVFQKGYFSGWSCPAVVAN
jgi:type VI protein secretion system component VasK